MQKFQLWCYYELEDKWALHGFYYSYTSARFALKTLREDVKTPNIPEWEIVEVRVGNPQG